MEKIKNNRRLHAFHKNVQPDQTVELSALLSTSSGSKSIYFKISNKENLHLQLEPQAEPFVLAVLFRCMEEGTDLIVEHALDPEFLFNLNTQLIPFLCSHYQKLHRIIIQAESLKPASKPDQNKLNLLGMSCGLDALTAYADLNAADSPAIYRPQGFLFNNIGAFGKGQDKYQHDLAIVQHFASQQGLPLFITSSNMGEFHTGNYSQSFSIRNSAAAWALNQICRHATYASGIQYNYINNILGKEDAAYLEPIIFPMMSAQGMKIYSSGFQHTRSDKFTLFLSRPELHPYLNTCLRAVERKKGFANCGTCKKCAELLMRAAAVNATQCMEKQFNLAEFHRQRVFLEYRLIYNAYNKDPSENSVDTLAFLRAHGASINPIAKILGWVAARLSRLL